MSKDFFCHIQLPANDLNRVKNFYKTVFNWNFENLQKDIILFNPMEGMGGSFKLVKEISANTCVLPYICVEDIEKTLELIIENNGSLIEIKTEIPGLGYVAKFSDTEGNVIALLEEYKNE